MGVLEISLLALCVVLVLLPAKWDPAIKIKERQENKRNGH